MKIKNATSWAPVGILPWVKTAAIWVAAFLLRWLLQPVLEELFPFTIFVITSLFIQYRFGLFKGLTSAVLGYVVGEWFFVQPYGEIDGLTLTDLFSAVQFFALTITCMFIIQRLRASQYEAKLLAEVAESRYLMLLQSESDRQAAERSFQVSRMALD
jgi:K+-sensing histidine kinase KdpD